MFIGGKFGPTLAYKILEENTNIEKNNDNDNNFNVKINVKGVIISDGTT